MKSASDVDLFTIDGTRFVKQDQDYCCNRSVNDKGQLVKPALLEACTKVELDVSDSETFIWDEQSGKCTETGKVTNQYKNSLDEVKYTSDEIDDSKEVEPKVCCENAEDKDKNINETLLLACDAVLNREFTRLAWNEKTETCVKTVERDIDYTLPDDETPIIMRRDVRSFEIVQAVECCQASKENDEITDEALLLACVADKTE